MEKNALKSHLSSQDKWRLQTFLFKNHERFTKEKYTIEKIVSVASEELGIETLTDSNVRNSYKIIGLKSPLDMHGNVSLKTEVVSLRRDVNDLKKIIVNLCNRLNEKIPDNFFEQD